MNELRSAEASMFRCIRVGLKGHPGIFPLVFMTCAGFLIVVDKSLVRACIAAGTTLLVFGSIVVASAYQMGRDVLPDEQQDVKP